MRTPIAIFTIATLTGILAVAGAQATPTQVNVRIEGHSETLFEGPIWTEGHDLKASSEDQGHACDGTNAKRYPTPGPTPTTAGADAMRIVGETFDGQWYPGYEDYFLTRWGPDRQSFAEAAYWGVLVNNVFAGVGGCQYELGTGDEVLWTYDAFADRPFLALFPEGDTSGARPLTATAKLGEPFEVEVLAYADSTEATPPSMPERTGSAPVEGARVSPVRTSSYGFEKAETEDPSTVTTDEQGKASIVFTTPGWQRIKATVVNGQRVEEAVRSNRLDVCVAAAGESTCGDPPREDRVRTPPPVEDTPSSSTPGGPDNPANKGRLESTVRFLQNAQNADGGFGGNLGEESSQDFSAWVTFALAADSINPQDQATMGGVDAYTYLTTHVARALHQEICKPIICTTSLERELLVTDAAGTSPHDYGGIDLVSELLARELPDGSFPFVPGGHGEINDTIYAILSLSLVQEPAAQNAVKHATGWLISEQNPDGSWSAQNSKTEAGEVDMTGAALQAINAPGQPAPGESQRKALDYLHGAQEPDGGFPERPGEGESNVASTAWATQGLWAGSENPENWVKGAGREPLEYMESLQQPDGHIRYRAREDVNGVWMTAYVAPAFAGQALPIPPVPRSTKGNPTPASLETQTSSPGPAEHGQGGESSQPGGGVIAGGGGAGAHLFSRPQPQSQGKKPGGRRELGSAHYRVALKNAQDPGSGSTEPGSGGSGDVRALSAAGSSDRRTYEQEVKGVLIGAPDSADARNAFESGAPGLHGAGGGGDETPWLAFGIAGALALSALLGAQIERQRSEVIL
jgi:prenyltransferase beta subunit